VKGIIVILLLLSCTLGWSQKEDATSYDSLGIQYRGEGKMNDAIWAFGKARQSSLVDEDWRSYAKAAHQQGWCYFFIAEFDSADWMLKEVLKVLDSRIQDDIERANIYYCLSAVSARKSKNSLAVDYAMKAVDIAINKEEYKAELAKFYNALGIAYSFKFDFQKSLEAYSLSVELKKELWGERSIEVAKSYNNIGVVYRELGEIKKALEYYEKSLDIKTEIAGPGDSGVADTYNNMAILYQDLGDLDKSIELLLKSLDIERAIYGENSYALVDKYGVLATAYKNKGMYQIALDYNEKCFAIWRNVFSENHDLYARTLRSNGDIYAEMGDFPAAFNYYHRSLMELLGKFGENERIPVPDNSLLTEKMDVLFTLSNYAKAVLDNYYKTQNSKMLDKALLLYDRSSDVVDMLRTGYKEEVSRLALQDNAADVYEGAITASYELFLHTDDASFIDKAFHYSEKNKSTVLQSFIIENKALEYSGIPSSVLDKERQLKADLKIIEEEVQSQKGKAGQELLNKQYEARITYENFIDKLESDYPDYHQLKYNINQATIEEVGQYAEEKNLGLLEFFWGEEWIYTFSISPSGKSASRIPATDSIRNLISTFRSQLSDSDIAFNNEKNIQSFNELNNTSLLLYNTFLKGRISTDVSSLVIVPDGPLYSIPMELLITDQVKMNVPNYSDLPFLIKKKPIRYLYSFNQMVGKNPDKKPENKLATFAPVYGGQVNTAYASREAMSSLQYAYQEAVNIAEKYGGDLYAGPELNKALFKDNAKDYNILHLAMHAYTDDNNPMYSGMIFSNDEVLHAYELYNMELKADMVVLSACNTGVGKSIKGEGVMSLARAFRHAGVNNIVMSQWQADDETTQTIMTSFYKHLASGLSKDVALSKAKLDYITENSRKVHPYFWGSFILVGDAEPVSLNLAFNMKDYLIMGIMFVLVLSVAWLIIRYMQ
jgi:CHAT domain-containing protein